MNPTDNDEESIFKLSSNPFADGDGDYPLESLPLLNRLSTSTKATSTHCSGESGSRRVSLRGQYSCPGQNCYSN